MQNNEKNTTTPNVETFSFGEHTVRVIIDKAGEPWFVAVDICRILELDTSYAIKGRKSRNFEDGIDERYMDNVHVPHPQSQNKTIEVLALKEAGLYQLIFKSRKKEAEAFKFWVFDEVLPSIRKHGYYMMPAQEKNALMESVRNMVEKAFDDKMDGFVKQYLFPNMQKNQADVWKINTELTKQLVDLEMRVFDHLHALPQYKPVEAHKFVCYLYVLQKRFTNEYKIGKSIEPVERKFALELGGSELDILILIKIPNQELCLLWESLLQKTFELQSMGREWYLLAPYQIEFMRGLEKSFEILNRQ